MFTALVVGLVGLLVALKSDVSSQEEWNARFGRVAS